MRLLFRSDIRQRTDRPTNSIVLEYVGRRLTFDEYLYGYTPGTFFAVQLADVPYPEDVEEAAREAGLNVEALPDAPRLRQAVAEAIVAGAMVDAPAILAEMAEPEMEWSVSDRIDLERRHRIAEARVREVARLVLNDIRLRRAGIRVPSLAVTVPETVLPPLAPVPFCGSDALMRRQEGVSVTPLVDVTQMSRRLGQAESAETQPGQETIEEAVASGDDELLVPASRTVVRARQAVKAARESELPQRLPSGVRRRLQKMPPGAYVTYGEVLDVRADLCAALTDARALGRKDREVTVVDYDGEWPVVVRRYGQAGRTIYKVEDALRRAGVEIPAEAAA